MGDVLILGGYGNFGKRIAKALAYHKIPIVIAGRNKEKADALASQISSKHSAASIKVMAMDAEINFCEHLESLKPTVVINTCGPFQNKDYKIAETCILKHINYIDLADGREFVSGITRLDQAAKAARVSVVSGASTVPGLSSAVLDYYRSEFAQIKELKFGIAPGQKAERGLATTQGILTYIGKRLKPAHGDTQSRYGWQDLYRQKYPDLGYRWMANCDIPDLDLLPARYGIGKIQFSAGMENPILHFGIFILSWLVRLNLSPSLAAHGRPLLRASHWFDIFGSNNGGMHVIIRGKGPNGRSYQRQWFIIAKNGDGPQIPCIPAILIAKKLVQNEPVKHGAYPCVGTIALAEYLNELARFSVKTYEY